MNPALHLTDPTDAYCGALRSASGMPQPYGAVLFTMLTTLARLHELLHPLSRVQNGYLVIASLEARSARMGQRVVPLPVAAGQLFGHYDRGPVSLDLGVDAAALPTLGRTLRLLLLDQGTGCRLKSPEMVWSTAVQAAMVTAPSAEQRRAVLDFAGISGSRSLAASSGTRPEPAELQPVADLIDALIQDAGFAVTGEAISR